MILPEQKPDADKPDEELWSLFHEKKNIAAFEELYKRHNQRIFYFIYGYTRDYTLSTDILQDTVLKILQVEKELDPDFIVHNFVSWAIEFSKNILISRLRKMDRRQEILQENIMPKKNKSVEIKPDYDSQLLRECIKEVKNERYRSILHLTVEGLGIEEIAKQLQLCQKKVSDSKYLAKKEFERVLKQKGLFQEYKNLIT